MAFLASKKSKPPQAAAHGTTIGSTSNYPAVPYPAYYPAPARDGQATRIRFLKALIVAILVWVLFGTFIRTFIWASGGRFGSHGWGTYPIPSDITLGECAGSEDWKESFAIALRHSVPPELGDSAPKYSLPYESTTTFELPLSSNSLYLLARGPYASGVVEIETDPRQKSDSVGVHVKASYYRKEARDVVKVCEISRGPGDSGVGIFTPWYFGRGYGYNKRVHIHVTIVIPELNRKSWPLLIKNLETDVQNAPHIIHAMTEEVKFDRLELRGTNGHISAEGVGATTAILNTSNSGISGVFNVSRELTLETSNGQVSVSANLANSPSDDPTKLRVRTSNAAVGAYVKLREISSKRENRLGTVSENRYPQYDVLAKSSNGRLEVIFDESPAEATLRFEGSTSNAIATGILPPAYQGDFVIQTSNSPAELNVKETNPPDPSGRDRTRKVERIYVSKTQVKGKIEWVGGSDDRNDERAGMASLKTSNSKVTLVV